MNLLRNQKNAYLSNKNTRPPWFGSKKVHVEPGSPWKNGYCESFNGRFRDELLNGEIFYSLREALIIIED